MTSFILFNTITFIVGYMLGRICIYQSPDIAVIPEPVAINISNNSEEPQTAYTVYPSMVPRDIIL